MRRLTLGCDEVLGLVFDLPDAAWMAEVRRIRSAYDVARLPFPIEITVAGSSGLGWFSPEQSLVTINENVRAIARSTLPFTYCFSRVAKFPRSRVYYLALANEAPFHSFQRALAASPLRFAASEFSYTPHCTIAALSELAPPAVHQELAAFPFPATEATISSLSLYAVNASTGGFRHVSCIPMGA